MVCCLAVMSGTLLSAVHADEKQPAAPKPLEQLQRNLTAALGNRFEFVEGQLAEKSRDRYWLAKVRPKQEGEFVLRCEIKNQKPDAAGYDGRTITYHLVIGKAGFARVHNLSHYGTYVYPHACVGDILILPVPVFFADDIAHCRFEMPQDQSPEDENWFRIIKEIADAVQEMKKRTGNIEIRNGANDVLALVTGIAESHTSRSSKGPTIHTFDAVFDVVKPGKFNLETSLKWKDGENKQAPQKVSFGVIAKDQPLSVMIDQWEIRSYSGNFTSGGTGRVSVSIHPLRVGDWMILFCGEYRTFGGDRPARDQHPWVELVKRPLNAPAEPFKPIAK